MKRGIADVTRRDEETQQRGDADQVLERGRASQNSRKRVETDGDAGARDRRCLSDEQGRENRERQQQPIRRARRMQTSQQPGDESGGERNLQSAEDEEVIRAAAFEIRANVVAQSRGTSVDDSLPGSGDQ